MYAGVLKATRKYHNAKEFVLIDSSEQYQAKVWLYMEKENKTVQSLRAGSETVPTAVEKWNKKFEELNLRNYIFVKCHESTPDSQLNCFRIWKIVETTLFTFCGQEEETVDHLFWNCGGGVGGGLSPPVQGYWENV